MNYLTISLGLFFVIISIMFLIRSLKPKEAVGKLKSMLDYWGNIKGVWLYRIFYVGIPAFLGVVVIISGINGNSIGDFLQNINR